MKVNIPCSHWHIYYSRGGTDSETWFGLYLPEHCYQPQPFSWNHKCVLVSIFKISKDRVHKYLYPASSIFCTDNGPLLQTEGCEWKIIWFSSPLKQNKPVLRLELQPVLKKHRFIPNIEPVTGHTTLHPWLVGRRSCLVTWRAVTLLNHKRLLFISLSCSWKKELYLELVMSVHQTFFTEHPVHIRPRQSSALGEKVVFALEELQSGGQVRNIGDSFNIIPELRSKNWV